MSDNDPESLFDEGLPVVELGEALEEAVEARDANPAQLKNKAETTAKITRASALAIGPKIKQLPGLDRIIESLNNDKSLLEFGMSPDFQEAKHHEAYSEVVTEALAIIETYKNGEINFAMAQEDVLKLGAILTNLSEKLASFQGLKANAETRIKRGTTRAYVHAKRVAHQENIKLSDTDAKELGAYYVDRIVEEQGNLEFIERYVANMYFSIKGFQEMLNYVAGREARINNFPNQA